ncbi:hypothetical protein ASG89_23280 [Paenibacillus sp. Soil766]|nr:hypothetical protein ASG89_23280 [Paenibacillus sp. Soil766]
MVGDHLLCKINEAVNFKSEPTEFTIRCNYSNNGSLRDSYDTFECDPGAVRGEEVLRGVHVEELKANMLAYMDQIFNHFIDEHFVLNEMIGTKIISLIAA